MSDAPEVFRRWASDPEVAARCTWRPAKEVWDTEDFLHRGIDAWDVGFGHRPWMIEVEGELVGSIGVTVEGHRAELGYLIMRSWWGRGLMTEVAQTVVDHCFSCDAIERVWAVAEVDNPASWRVLEKVGMEQEGVLRKWVHIDGTARDCRVYAKLR